MSAQVRQKVGGAMTRVKLPFVQEYRDRHGHVRRYVRRRGRPNVPLPGLPGSSEFMAAYAEAIGGAAPAGKPKGAEGSFAHVVLGFSTSNGSVVQSQDMRKGASAPRAGPRRAEKAAKLSATTAFIAP